MKRAGSARLPAWQRQAPSRADRHDRRHDHGASQPRRGAGSGPPSSPPEPGDDALVAGFGPALACACWPVRPCVGLRLLAGRLTGGRIAGMPFSHVSLGGVAGSRNPGRPVGRGRAPRSRKPGSDHIGTVSITSRVRRASRNSMNPGSSA
jgi:hypothetical protein